MSWPIADKVWRVCGALRLLGAATVAVLVTTSAVAAQPADVHVPPLETPVPADPSPVPADAGPAVLAAEPRRARLTAAARAAGEVGNCDVALESLRLLIELDPSYTLVGEHDINHCIWRSKRRLVPATPVVPAVPAVPVVRGVRSYRKQVIITDLLSLATMPVGVGLLGYLFGAPVVHAMNGNSDSAGKSLGLRVLPIGVLFGTAYLLTSMSDCEELPEGCLGEGLIALGAAGLSMLVVMVIDSAVLATKTEVKSTGLTWTPTASVHDRGANVGIMGTW